MTEALALARSKAKHPPDKTVAEARKVKARVEKSNTNRRQRNMTTREQEIRATMATPVADRIARMEAFMDDLDREAAVTGEGTEAMRLSGARLLEQEAVRLTQSGDADDYPAAVRQAVGGVRPARSEADEEEVHGSIHYLDRDEYEARLRQTMKERGYDV